VQVVPDDHVRARPRGHQRQSDTMNREQKEAAVAELSKELSESEAIFAVDYRGISVPQAAELRAQLRDADARFRVVKNRLTLRAADQAGTESLKEWLEGPTALALVKGDVALAAKTITKLGSEYEVLTYKGGLMEGEVLDPDQFKAIAKLPGRDQMNAQIAGMVASPLTGLVRGLGSMVQGLAMQLKQIADQGLVTGEAPAEEVPAEVAPAEQAEGEPEQTPDTPTGEAEDVGGNDGNDESAGKDAEKQPSEGEPEGEPAQEQAPEEQEPEKPAGEETSGEETSEPEQTPDTPAGEAEDVAEDEGKEE
jgi:large subunit ribosomal protein L10